MKLPPGINTVPDGRGGTTEVLAWDDGTTAEAEGRDLAAVCRSLSREQLDLWLARLEGKVFDAAGVIRAELNRRDPLRKAGTLWADLPDEAITGEGG